MTKLFTEYKLTDEELQKYDDLGIEPEPVYANTKITDVRKGEYICFLLNTMYPHTIQLIEYILWRNQHTRYYNPVKIKYDNKTYVLTIMEEWKYTCQSDKDQIKTKTINHPLREIYLDKRREYREQQELIKKKQFYIDVTEQLLYVPESEELLDATLRALTPLYDIKVDYENTLDKLRCYNQVLYYQEHNIPTCPKTDEILIGREDIIDVLANHPNPSQDLIDKILNKGSEVLDF